MMDEDLDRVEDGEGMIGCTSIRVDRISGKAVEEGGNGKEGRL